jgi:SNF2 family DNA or RNA helicase
MCKLKLIDNKAVEITLRNESADLVLSDIEKSQLIEKKDSVSRVLIHWGLDEMTRLSSTLNLSKPLPSPVSRDYQWAGIYSPFKHQVNTTEFLTINKRAFCFNEAGTGKTSSVLWAADYLMEQKKIKRVLIICPLSIMYSAWQGDIFNTCMHRTSAVCHGSARKREDIIDASYEFVIINYDGVGVVKEAIKKANFDLIVIDECNAYKSTSTARWKTLRSILLHSTRVWMLTGTPASQSPEDAYGLAKLIRPERVPKFKNAWRDKVMYQVSRFKWLPRPTSKTDVYKALQPAIRFAKDECLDLPEVMYQTRDVMLTKQAEKYYKELKNQMLIETAGESITAVNAAAGLNKLLQISGGAVYTDNSEVITFDIKPRLTALREVIEETKQKVLVFVPYRHTIEVVSKFLDTQGISNEVIHGDVSASRRASIINEFQTSDEPRVFVIQPQSASHGVTLTRANVVVFWSPVMSVEVYLQCIARMDRVGQKHKMTVVHLQGSDVERRMYAMLRGKVDAHTALVDLYREEIGL